MPLVILCPGQGGQHPAMFQRLHDQQAAAPLLANAASLLQADPLQLAGAPSRFSNHIAQPLVCAAAVGHWLALRDQLPRPLAVAGYSAGELAAHAVAGSIEPMQCLALAQQRACLMDAASPADAGLMAVLGLPRAVVDALCAAHGCWVAIVNGADHFVLGGLRPELQSLATTAAAQGARTVDVPVCVPSHTPLLQQAAEDFAVRLQQQPLRAPSLRLLAAIDARVVADVPRVFGTLAAQIASTLQWQRVIEQAGEYGGRVFLELGPGAALSRMVRDQLPGAQARSVEDFRTLEGVLEWVDVACARA